MEQMENQADQAQASPESLAQAISEKLDELIAMVDESTAEKLLSAKQALASVSGEGVEPENQGQAPMSGGPGAVPAY